jgi:hypothetical protein
MHWFCLTLFPLIVTRQHVPSLPNSQISKPGQFLLAYCDLVPEPLIQLSGVKEEGLFLFFLSFFLSIFSIYSPGRAVHVKVNRQGLHACSCKGTLVLPHITVFYLRCRFVFGSWVIRMGSGLGRVGQSSNSSSTW